MNREPLERTSEREHWDRFWDISEDVDEVYSNEGRVSERLSRIVPLAGRRVLEVGAGTGRDGIMMSMEGAFVVSLDYSSRSLAMIAAQVDHGGPVAPCCGDAFALPFEEDTFDIVFHQGLLEHFRNPGDMIEENMRVLKPGGYLLVDVPQRYHYYTIVKHIFIAAGKWFAGWETEYSAGQLERLIEAHSFSVVSSYGEWLNPPIWYRMLRKGLLSAGIRLPMYPAIFTVMNRLFGGLRSFILGRRWGLYTAVVVGTIARKNQRSGS